MSAFHLWIGWTVLESENQMSPSEATAALLQNTIRTPSTSVSSRLTTPVVVLMTSRPWWASAISSRPSP